MAAVKADGLLYLYGSHFSSLFQLTSSNQTSSWVREGIKVSGAGGRQWGEKAQQTGGPHTGSVARRALVPGSW